jgi:predicted short-subunit dehydrogenase-like oxidoreductase (DUF2520 family)
MPDIPSPAHQHGRPTIGFIGVGRVATTLAMAWAQTGENIVAVSSRSPASMSRLVSACKGHMTPETVASPQEVADRCSLVFVTVPDDAIVSVDRDIRWRKDQSVVHCSAATEVSALAHAATAGANTGGFHPLQLFSDPAVAIHHLQGATVAIEAQGALQSELLRLAELLGMRPLDLPAGTRIRYHLAANLAASGLLAVLKEAEDIWTSCGLPRDVALDSLLPLAAGTLAAAREAGLAQAVSGPVARCDTGVIRRHLHALAHAEGGSHLYMELLKRLVELARSTERLSDTGANEIRNLLTQALKE